MVPTRVPRGVRHIMFIAARMLYIAVFFTYSLYAPNGFCAVADAKTNLPWVTCYILLSIGTLKCDILVTTGKPL